MASVVANPPRTTGPTGQPSSHHVRFAPLPPSSRTSSSHVPVEAASARRVQPMRHATATSTVNAATTSANTDTTNTVPVPSVTQVVRDPVGGAAAAFAGGRVGGGASSARAPSSVSSSTTSASSEAPQEPQALARTVRMDTTLSEMTRRLESDTVRVLAAFERRTDAQIYMIDRKVGERSERIEKRMDQGFKRSDERMARIEAQMNDFMQGVNVVYQRRSLEVNEIKTSPFLHMIIEFVCDYAMDTRYGFMAAYPLMLPPSLDDAAPEEPFIVISVPLLSVALKKLFPAMYSLHKVTAQQILLNMQKLHPVTSNIRADVLASRTLSVFPVRQYANSHMNGAWIVFTAADFIGFYRQIKNLPSVLSAPAKDMTVFQQLYERKTAVRAATQGQKRSKVMWCREAATNKTMVSKMAWGREVQSEVLVGSGVVEFFRRVKLVLQNTDTARTTEMFKGERPGPFHFRGPCPLFGVPVYNHDTLVTRDESAASGAGGAAAAEAASSSTDESEQTNSLSEPPKSRKRKSDGSAASAGSRRQRSV